MLQSPLVTRIPTPRQPDRSGCRAGARCERASDLVTAHRHLDHFQLGPGGSALDPPRSAARPSSTMARYRRQRSGAMALVYADTELSISSMMGTSVATKSARRCPSDCARSTSRVTTGTMLFRATGHPLSAVATVEDDVAQTEVLGLHLGGLFEEPDQSLPRVLHGRRPLRPGLPLRCTACSKRASISSSLHGKPPVDRADPEARRDGRCRRGWRRALARRRPPLLPPGSARDFGLHRPATAGTPRARLPPLRRSFHRLSPAMQLAIRCN